MNHIHKRRIYTFIIFAIGITLAASLILYALKQNINAFMTPSQLKEAHVATDYHFRLGGMVKQGSVIHASSNLDVTFIVSDLKQETRVEYNGVLPDLFREGKGVIAEGHIDDQGTFIASTILAKHDENYMPKNVYKALRENSKTKI